MKFSTWPRLLVVDVEGNGANPPDLVEIAAIPVENGEPQPDALREWLIRPPAPIPPRITRIHGITNDMVTGAPAWVEVAGEVGSVLDSAWICAHSAGVEYGVLTRHLPGWQPAGVIDTLRLAKAALPGHKGFGLDPLIQHAGIELDSVAGTRHRAGYDAHATALLLQWLAARYDTWDELITHAVPPQMPGLPAAVTPEDEHEEQTLW
ncbi:exonuclease domain-containing protein [Streptomyces uncialis]|uniref:3'-5' exonuclease n=1 Tax=Streptomyces uncialis TaxID=1048205 RepID=UPI0037B8007D